MRLDIRTSFTRNGSLSSSRRRAAESVELRLHGYHQEALTADAGSLASSSSDEGVGSAARSQGWSERPDEMNSLTAFDGLVAKTNEGQGSWSVLCSPQGARRCQRARVRQ